MTPDPTPQEAEAIRKALEALGLVEPAPPADASREGDETPPPPNRGLSP